LLCIRVLKEGKKWDKRERKKRMKKETKSNYMSNGIQLVVGLSDKVDKKKENPQKIP
jgi:hypothetical protein